MKREEVVSELRAIWNDMFKDAIREPRENDPFSRLGRLITRIEDEPEPKVLAEAQALMIAFDDGRVFLAKDSDGYATIKERGSYLVPYGGREESRRVAIVELPA